METPSQAQPATNTRHHNFVQRTALLLFKVGLVTFLSSGVLLVLIQVFGLATANEQLTINTIPGLPQVMTITAGITGIIAFGMSYLFKWDTGGED